MTRDKYIRYNPVSTKCLRDVFKTSITYRVYLAERLFNIFYTVTKIILKKQKKLKLEKLFPLEGIKDCIKEETKKGFKTKKF